MNFDLTCLATLSEEGKTYFTEIFEAAQKAQTEMNKVNDVTERLKTERAQAQEELDTLEKELPGLLFQWAMEGKRHDVDKAKKKSALLRERINDTDLALKECERQAYRCRMAIAKAMKCQDRLCAMQKSAKGKV